jgi:glutamine amidotransferase
MCRFVFYQGSPVLISSLIIHPDHSLVDQSVHAWEREDPLNADGFGVAWFDPDVRSSPAVFKSVSPAWSDHNLMELSDMVTSPCVLAHVRAATHGTHVSEVNCHPFKWRDFAFMHNGVIGGFEKIKKQLIHSLSEEAYGQVRGHTDSEHFFALIVDEILSSKEPTKDLISIVSKALKRLDGLLRASSIKESTHLNFVLTNGVQTLVARMTNSSMEIAPSLHFIEGDRYDCIDGVCQIINDDPSQHAMIFSSEPLIKSEDWQDVSVNKMYLIERSRIKSVHSATELINQ